MKTIIDYLKEHGKYEHDAIGRAFDIELIGNHILLKYNENTLIFDIGLIVEAEIQEALEECGIEIRFCEECGKPFDAGFMADDGSWYSCEECFEDAMDKTYGKGMWRASEEEGEYGGWYENFDGEEWVDTSVFYTEWY